MNTTEIRELTDADLDIVSGGWKLCVGGTTGGAGPGLVPDYSECAPTFGDIIQIALDTAEKGRKIQQQHGGGGGRPA